MRMLCTVLVVLLVFSISLSVSTADTDSVQFKKIVVDTAYRSEGVAVGDVNNDGAMDIMAGEFWYAAPDWEMSEIQKPGAYNPLEQYSQTFGQFACDLNKDGWIDVIVTNMENRPALWFENPQGKAGYWKKHIGYRHNTANETPVLSDLLGTGKPVPVFAVRSEGNMCWFDTDVDEGEQWKAAIVAGPEAPGTKKYAHGLGVGDINGDGRNDIVIMEGWWEAPEDRTQTHWKFHNATLTPDCADMLVYDADGDGDSDVITSSAHNYGIWWHENIDGKATEFKRHTIYDEVSQTHAMRLADINDDGVMDLVTGKRFFSHHGADPGANEPAMLLWFEIRRTKHGPKFIRHEIDNNSGIGTQFEVADMNADGKPDVIVSNKKGVFAFIQE